MSLRLCFLRRRPMTRDCSLDIKLQFWNTSKPDHINFRASRFCLHLNVHTDPCPISCPLCPFMPPKKKWLRFKRASTYYLGIAMLCQLLPQATFKAMGFFLLGPRLVDFHGNLHESWKSLQMWQVCYRLADPKCQCLSSAVAGLTSYSKRNHQGKSRFAAGMEPEVGADKTNALGTHHFLDMFFFRRALRIKAEA